MPPDPLILGFDTSAAHCAAALLSGNTVLAHRHETMTKGQAERLMGLIEEMLTETGVTWTDLTAIGVGVGPGNFTGIRISVSAARGLALALSRPAIGVSGFEALAEGFPGPIVASIDARRDNLFLQLLNTPDSEPPIQTTIPELPDRIRQSGATCVGYRAEEIARAIAAPHAPACHPQAIAIARIAATRCQSPQPRPAPLYVRAADAAPSRQPAPVILP